MTDSEDDSMSFNECLSLTSNAKQPDKCESMSLASKIRAWWKKTCRRLYPTGFKAELKNLTSLTFPILAAEFGFLGLTLTPLYFCGHLETTVELDVAGLAVSLLSSTVIAMGFGIANACSTYTSQAFASGEKEKIGLFVQTAMYVSILTLLPILALHLNVGSFLYAFGQDLIISKLVGDYIFVMIPGTICFYFYEVLDKYMIAQNILFPSVLSMAIAAVLNIVLHYVLVVHLQMGLLGSSLSLSMSLIFLLVFMYFYILIRKLQKGSWTGFRTESLQYFVPYSKLAFSSMFQECSEVWIFDIGIFLTGYLSQEELGAQSIVTNLDVFWNQVPASICMAVLTMTGQYISVSNIEGTKTIYRVALTFMLSLSTIFCGIAIVWRKTLPEIFTDKREVIDEASILLVLVGIYSLSDGACLVLIGLLLGIGKHLWAFKTTLIGYYVISFPLGMILMFATPLRSKGFYIGIAVGSVSKLVYLCIVVCRINWQQEVANAFERISGTESDLEDVLLNLSNEPPSEHKNTAQIWRNEKATEMLPKCISRLSRVLNSGNSSTRAIRFGIPLTSIAIFIIGIICRLTIELPEVNSTDLFKYNISAIHNFSHRYEPN